MSDPLWTEADKLHFRRTRARCAAQSALEQRFVEPEDMMLEALLENSIRDVYASNRAWVDAVKAVR